MQPAYAAAKFYSSLVQVPGWQSLSLTQMRSALLEGLPPGSFAWFLDDRWGALTELSALSVKAATPRQRPSGELSGVVVR
jgi:hypothetical protein